VLSTREGLDHEHRCAALSAQEGGLGATVIGAARGRVCVRRRRRLMEQHAGGGDIVFAVRVGEDAVVADAMEAGGQDMQQEAAHELCGGQGHGFLAGAPVFAVVLPAERNAAIIRCD